MFSADLGINQVASTPAATDPPFQKVALLLHGDGTNGAQNNTFLDSSTNNFTITRTGNVAQGTFSPFSLAEGQWSNYFDGTGDYISIAASAGLSLNADFTVECWFNPTVSFNSLESVFSIGRYDDGILVRGSSIYINNVNIGSVSSYITVNAWSHIAVVRSGTSVVVYVNGVSRLTTTTSGTVNATPNQTNIGSATHGLADTFTGYISNLRIVKGTAVYTSNFTVPTAPLTAISGTSLLTCQSNRFKDNSSNNFTITRAGDTKVTAWSPFAPSAAYSASTNGGSAYFDGSGDYLSIADSASLEFGSGDLNIESWVYITGNPVAYVGTYAAVIASKNSDDSNVGFYFCLTASSTAGFTGLNFIQYYRGSSSESISRSYTFTQGQWYHLAVSKQSNVVKLFINGVQQGASVSFTQTQSDSAAPVTIGGQNFSGGYNYYFPGYLSNVRIVKGSAVYTSDFTPPTAPLTAVSGTQLLLNFTNAGIFDNSGKNDIETVGNAQISTSVKKYGTGSMYFDGTGDYISTITKDVMSLSTGDFTIEFWVNFSSVTGGQQIVSGYGPGTAQNWAFYTASSGSLNYYLSSNGSSWNIASGNSVGSIATGNWYHVALVRSGSTFTPYLNGVAGTTATSSASLFNGTSTAWIGAAPNATAYFTGYIDDLRITKGQALYTSNFTPPTQAFPNQ